jgi:hypothetical protein
VANKTIAQILSEIGTLFPDNTAKQILPSQLRQFSTDLTNYTGAVPSAVFNVRTFGAVGDGVTDDSAAIDACTAAVAAAGGGTIFFPPGNYLMSTDTFIPPSNTLVQGSGIDATTITNTSTAGGKDCVLTVLMTMTGGPTAGLWPSTNTTYPINAPTQGGTTVTTTTASDAGNFSAGNIILISGGLHGSAFWYPSWYTTVVSANAGTGVITLAETLPFGGSSVTTVQKILALPKNITVRDMTLTVNSNIGGVSGAIMEILGVENFLIERVKFVTANPLTTTGAGVAIGAPAKYSGYRNCYAGQGAGPLELFGCYASFIEACSVVENSLLIDGGSMDCTAINNFIKDPQENAAAFHGIHCADYNLRCRIIGNVITGLSGTFAGINTTSVPDLNRQHVIVGNSITGVGSGSTNGINTCNGVVAGNMFSNLQNGIQMDPASTVIVEGNQFDPSVNNFILPFSGGGVFRTRQQTNLRSMASATASPTVVGGAVYQLFNGSAQNVTGFTGGFPGDEITINMGDGNTTFVNSGGSLQMKGGANYNPVSGVTMCFICLTSTIWAEKSRSA